MKKIGVISDTHGLLRPEVKENMKDCEAILHAGDINQPELLDELREIAPVRAVCGNADESWAEQEGLAQTASLDLFGLKIFMTHNKKQVPRDTDDYDIIITGHTHKFEVKETDGQTWLNPGTCGPRRRTLPLTTAIIEIGEDGTFEIKRIDIPRPEETKKTSDKKSSDKKNAEKKETSRKTSRKKKKEEDIVTVDLIARVISDINAATPIPKIAEKRGISEDLAKEICQLYVTHQGIDAEGVFAKMEREIW